MWRSATSSEARRRVARAWPSARGRALVLALAMCALRAPGAAARQVVTQEEALRGAFPAPARIERRTAYLDEAQLEAARRLAGAGVEVTQSVVTYYVAEQDGSPLGVAYFDVHRVRTLNEVVMVVVDTAGRTGRIEVIRFAEPPEYRAPASWLSQFEGRPLGPGLTLRRAIVNMTGATLTAQAVSAAVRRVLALHAIIAPFAEPK